MLNLFSKSKTKWKSRDIILFLERLEMYLSAGLEINKALQLSEEGLSLCRRKNIDSIKLAVESGNSLWKAMHSFIGISDTTSGLIEHGESSGLLSKSVLSAKILLEREDELRKKCLSAMVYPIVIGTFSVILVIGLVRGVMPQIIPMLRNLHVELPIATKVVIFFSEFLISKGIYLALILLFLVLILRFSFKKFLIVKKIFHLIIMKIPIIGRIFFNYYLAVFLHSCGLLIESGLSVNDSYLKTMKTIALVPLNQSLRKKSDDLFRGISIDTIISDKNISPFIPALLRAGEISGTLGLSMIRTGNILDKQIDQSLKRLTALIEPIMMIGMGCVIGTIAVSIMMPIYSISSALQR